jgi:prepilin-type N-terminal cleavage/methylation domain-containing protein
MRHFPNDQKGFSLVEVLIAMTIFAIGVMALAQMQITAIRGNAFSSTTTDGTTLAQDRVEQLMNLPYDDGALAAGNHGPITQGVYNVSWDVANGPVTNTKTVDVSVTWTANGWNRTVALRCIKGAAG